MFVENNSRMPFFEVMVSIVVVMELALIVQVPWYMSTLVYVLISGTLGAVFLIQYVTLPPSAPPSADSLTVGPLSSPFREGERPCV